MREPVFCSRDGKIYEMKMISRYMGVVVNIERSGFLIWKGRYRVEKSTWATSPCTLRAPVSRKLLARCSTLKWGNVNMCACFLKSNKIVDSPPVSHKKGKSFLLSLHNVRKKKIPLISAVIPLVPAICTELYSLSIGSHNQHISKKMKIFPAFPKQTKPT